MAERPRAKKSLGQNFLVDPNLQRKIVAALEAGPDDEVLEIGPGQGALTEHLEGRVRRLVLVELDDALAANLQTRFRGRSDVEVVHGDVLTTPLNDHVEHPSALRVLGNIPYNITTPILFRILERPRPAVIVLMVQLDVADRIVAPVGTGAYGALSVGVRSVAHVTRLFKVARGAFRPVPRVDSAIIRIEPFRPERTTPEIEARLRTLVRAAFQWRRKQLGTILRDHPDISCSEAASRKAAARANITLTDRPERLSPEAFIELVLALP
ncbi:MAG: 16S rRNA (adenine(1518)-N(6)/adenine(1519)-N(6))-dimethyltransferase RsmA [Gemmatimonadota bacterium]|nr:16S rRNA (adenine(1518)-N(6)/adenine(1519)-N(6))-dimethyltransferase RsmA [Gemmatimonadota bacterium]